MRCKKVQAYIPDLRTGAISPRRRTWVERHLVECETCRQWLSTWDGLCDLSLEACLPPQKLDWEPFQQALEAELQHRPVSDHRRLAAGNIWRYLIGELWIFPKRMHLRVIITAAAAGFIIFVSSHLRFFSQHVQDADNLIIGSYLTSNLQGGVVLYNEGEADRVYYHEVINLETLEGKD